MRQRNLANVFPSAKPEDFTAIILAAGEADIIRSFGSNRSLVSFKDTNLINHQISTIKKKFSLSNIIVVLGFDADRTARSVPKGVRIVMNERWVDTGPVHSLFLGLLSTTTPSAFIVSGDIYFEHNSLIVPKTSTLISSTMKPNKIGISTSDNRVTHLAFGIDNKWSQMSYFVGDDLNKLRKNISDDKSCLYETINNCIDAGVEFTLVRKDNILEINSYKDVESLN